MAAKKTNTKKTTVKKAEPTVAPLVENTQESELVTEETPVVENKPKKFETTDTVPCQSITAGELIMVGEKTKIVYKWADRGDIQDIEYQDLIYAIRSNSGFVFKPRFVILDNDIIAQNPNVSQVYEKMYSTQDLKQILRLPARQLKEVITELPVGAKESLKNLASTMIANGQLDSVQSIKVIDEIFDTELKLLTEFYN